LLGRRSNTRGLFVGVCPFKQELKGAAAPLKRLVGYYKQGFLAQREEPFRGYKFK